MSGALRIGLAGLGTVGGGVVRLLAEHADLIAERAGRPIRVTAVSARDKARNRDLPLEGVRWSDDPLALASAADVDVVVEVIGGAEGIAKNLTQAAIGAAKPVVTANKAMLALHGTALARIAEAKGVPIACEAAVAGGIPIVKALREGLAANRMTRVFGILNGTCNYILTQMQTSGRGFGDVLSEAQALGYAEADPSFDVDGIDAAHKLAVLAGIAFNRPMDFGSVHIEGIRAVEAVDIEYARDLGYRIKLLAIARRTATGIEQRVHPCMVAADSAIAHVDGVFNAVVAEGDFVDRTMYVGRGAGAGPTASAVVADLIDVARGRVPPLFGVGSTRLADIGASPMLKHVGPYYVRLNVLDRPGVIADVAAILRDEKISIESMLQRARGLSGEAVPVVLVTHETEEAAMQRALSKIAVLPASISPPCMIRIEQL